MKTALAARCSGPFMSTERRSESRQGDPTLKGVTPGRPVRDRAVELDLVMLMTALNWATRERTTTGRRLLRENPLTGVRDETVQSASVRRLAAAGLQVGPDRAAA